MSDKKLKAQRSREWYSKNKLKAKNTKLLKSYNISLDQYNYFKLLLKAIQYLKDADEMKEYVENASNSFRVEKGS